MPKKLAAEPTTEPTGPVALHYIGDGSYIVGVPAEDHAVDSPAEADRLIATRLYELAAPTTTTIETAADAATTAKE